MRYSKASATRHFALLFLLAEHPGEDVFDVDVHFLDALIGNNFEGRRGALADFDIHHALVELSFAELHAEFFAGTLGLFALGGAVCFAGAGGRRGGEAAAENRGRALRRLARRGRRPRRVFPRESCLWKFRPDRGPWIRRRGPRSRLRCIWRLPLSRRGSPPGARGGGRFPFCRHEGAASPLALATRCVRLTANRKQPSANLSCAT